VTTKAVESPTANFKNYLVPAAATCTKGGREMKKLIVSIVVLVLSIPQICSTADLDAPVEKKVMTVRSEIERGSDSFSTSCNAGNVSGVAECVSQIRNVNAQKSMDTEPFLLGLYFRAWISADIIVRVHKSRSISTGLEDVEARLLHKWLSEIRKRQNELNLDDETLCKVAKVPYDKVKPWMDEFETSTK
jgi:hypothetical protein